MPRRSRAALEQIRNMLPPVPVNGPDDNVEPVNVLVNRIYPYGAEERQILFKIKSKVRESFGEQAALKDVLIAMKLLEQVKNEGITIANLQIYPGDLNPHAIPDGMVQPYPETSQQPNQPPPPPSIIGPPITPAAPTSHNESHSSSGPSRRATTSRRVTTNRRYTNDHYEP